MDHVFKCIQLIEVIDYGSIRSIEARRWACWKNLLFWPLDDQKNLLFWPFDDLWPFNLSVRYHYKNNEGRELCILYHPWKFHVFIFKNVESTREWNLDVSPKLKFMMWHFWDEYCGICQYNFHVSKMVSNMTKIFSLVQKYWMDVDIFHWEHMTQEFECVYRQ